jgi:tRNA threonylcarbamoyladenosine biosynthesis protein TsaB
LLRFATEGRRSNKGNCYQITGIEALLGTAGLCNAEKEMPESQSVTAPEPKVGLLVLGVDTCGPSGSVALATLEGGTATILSQIELEGRSYSATLVSAVKEILAHHGVKLAEIGAMVVVIGPGSFTGVRVGLSVVKGLAEPFGSPVVAVSRLEVLAYKAGVASAALDAHRHEVFLRLAEPGGNTQELLAGNEELARLRPPEGGVAVCDDAAAELFRTAWPGAKLVSFRAPMASDALECAAGRVLAAEFADLTHLDGHYLRRSDAEIFGGKPKQTAKRDAGISVRRMASEDLERVMEIATKTPRAPVWARQAYVSAIDPIDPIHPFDPEAQASRVAIVANDAAGDLAGFAIARITTPEAELESIVVAIPHQRCGVGVALFAALKSELLSQGAAELMLEVRESNRTALAFYRSLGFAEEGRRPRYYADPVEDAVLMRLRLK